MGIFSFFSREEDDEDEYEEEQTQEAGRQPESALTGELFKGMRMDVTALALRQGERKISRLPQPHPPARRAFL